LYKFIVYFGTEMTCIEHLAALCRPGGFACAACSKRQAWQLKARPWVYECAACRRQESGTAGTIFHRTRTDLSEWFLAAYLIGRDKHGVSAKFLQREVGVANQTAWTMAHKLRHGLSEDPSRPLHGLLEADKTFIGGRGDPTSLGRSTANPSKSLVVAAVEKVPAQQDQSGKHGRAVKRQLGFFAGDARIAVRPAATGAELGSQFASAGRRICRPSRCGRRSRRVFQVNAGDPGPEGQCRRILPDQATSKLCWSAPHHSVSASRATCGSGPTGSIAAICQTVWIAT
jgi:hypothetical protein